jgi:hypothetical protein
MLGKLYRRNKDGYIYEVIGQDDSPGEPDRWVMWNERVGERQIVMDIELERQVGWELVGTAKGTASSKPTTQEIPSALMK